MELILYIIDLATNLINSISDYLYNYILVGWLVVVGIFFSFRFGFVQIKLLKNALFCIMEKNETGVSSFQALMISTASRVGTGNIAGVASAIAIGGEGAIFWMWITAIIGSASAFIESTLAQIYKIKDKKEGGFIGGPAYYIKNAMKSPKLANIFAVILIITYAYGFNGLQSYNITESFKYYFEKPLLSNIWINIFGVSNEMSVVIWNILVSIILSVLLGAIIFGGAKRIGKITEILVPVMAIIYIILGIWIIVLNINKFPIVFMTILKKGLDFKAIAGGAMGTIVVQGIKRGLFSNEAGMGSAPNAAASADVSHPVKQGLVQVISVYIDTIIICSVTGFIIVLSNFEGKENLKGMSLVQGALNSQIGEIGIHIITISIFLFAFSSLVGNYFYAEANIKFLSDKKAVLFVFRLTCIFAVILGGISSFDLAWGIADVLMVFMTLINLFAIITLHPVAKVTLDDYIKKLKDNKELVFIANNVGVYDTECWK